MADPERIVIAWKGLPAYGARLIRSGLAAAGEGVIVIGTRPKAPVEEIEQILGAPIKWIADEERISWTDLGVAPPQLLFLTSWATPAFNHLGRLTKQAGGRVVGMYDNRYKGNLRQRLGAVYYRLVLRRRYDAVWTPGQSGRRFCRQLGVPDKDIYDGLYSGWNEVFQAGPPLDERPPRILFVGQYIRRKGLDELVEAWRRFAPEHPSWELHAYGQGPLQDLLTRTPGVTVHPFAQSPQIAAAMRQARFVIMPSHNDHWPLTVHEAASSGCGLLLSDAIGNRFDLASDLNAVIFPAGDATALEAALRAAAEKSESWLRQAGAESVRLAGAFSPNRFARVFQEICARFLPPR